MSTSSENSRRKFLIVSGLGLFGAAGLAAFPMKSLAQAKLKPVSESDPMAKTLGYHKDATKVDPKKWPKRAGKEGATQFCRTCILFNGGKPKPSGEGPCPLFVGGAVEAGGWCNSWAKNPAAT